ncbi:TonB-dependent receptor [Shewanella maritima]|uniref:TonB-dependent receptor n=1 Tax=Shewanella maritima TaxID=2520507 RepID=A0A411PL51_9GAMM|nr:TonB-dependent receptor [Shewanella maritima]QBF84250.1 TonB-dependent receptor [Shewanella maritima]
MHKISALAQYVGFINRDDLQRLIFEESILEQSGVNYRRSSARHSKQSIAAGALCLGLCAIVPFNVLANEAVIDSENIERIQVTGTRIKQVDIETASPLTVIDAQQIALSGEANIADVLNNTSVNSFGSWRGVTGYASGDSASSSVNMRGLGDGATLILLDGRRMPGATSSSGGIADTSQIPLAIVERIEILRDGASAIYGSDAVAGVINIITKKQYDGVELNISSELPQINGGDTHQISVSGGYVGDNGNISVSYERYSSQAVYDRDVWRLDDPSYMDYDTYNGVPNGYYYDYNLEDYVAITNSELCQQQPQGIDASDGNNQGLCLYNYGEVSTLYGDFDRNSVLSHFDYELTEDVTLKGRLSFADLVTEGATAPTPIYPAYIYMPWDHTYNPVGEEVELQLRSTQLGNRDERVETQTIDGLLGLQGYADIASGLDWELNLQHSKSTTKMYGDNLINDAKLQQAILATDENGDALYDIFNVSGMSFDTWQAQMAQMYQQAEHTSVYDSELTSTQVDGLVSTLMFDEGDYTIAAVAGFEHEWIDFYQVNDAESSAGLISGGAGGDNADADRKRLAGFMEFKFGLPADLELSAALRYERYSQSGRVMNTGSDQITNESATFDDVVPKLGALWRATDSLLLRASFGESFRAPNMIEMFSSDSLSFDYAYDPVWCANNDDPYYCSYFAQHATWFGGNPDLQAEKGQTLTLGGVWNVTDDWSLELSYYAIEYDNKIEAIDINDILYFEQINGGSDSVHRDENGQISYVESTVRNIASIETSGFDIVSAYNMTTGVGDFNLTLDIAHVIDYKYRADEASQAVDYAGDTDYPQWRGNFSLAWQYDVFSAGWSTVFIGKQSGQAWRDAGFESIIDTPNYFKHNLQVGYMHPFNGSVTLGVNNVFNADAPNWYDFASYQDVNTDLYDVIGRSLYLKLNQSF